MAFQQRVKLFSLFLHIVIWVMVCFLCPEKADAQIYRVANENKKNHSEEQKVLFDPTWKIRLSGIYNWGRIEDKESKTISHFMGGYRAGFFYLADGFSVGIEGSKVEALDKKDLLLDYLKKQEIGGFLSLDITPSTQPKVYVLFIFGKVKNKSRFGGLSSELSSQGWYVGSGIGIRYLFSKRVGVAGEYRLKYQKNPWQNFLFSERGKFQHEFSAGLELFF